MKNVRHSSIYPPLYLYLCSNKLIAFHFMSDSPTSPVRIFLLISFIASYQITLPEILGIHSSHSPLNCPLRQTLSPVIQFRRQLVFESISHLLDYHFLGHTFPQNQTVAPLSFHATLATSMLARFCPCEK